MIIKTHRMSWVLSVASLLLVGNTIMVTGGHWQQVSSTTLSTPSGSHTVESSPAETTQTVIGDKAVG